MSWKRKLKLKLVYCTGFDVPITPWTAEDIAYWTGTPHYQPWKDVAGFFANERKRGGDRW